MYVVLLLKIRISCVMSVSYRLTRLAIFLFLAFVICSAVEIVFDVVAFSFGAC